MSLAFEDLSFLTMPVNPCSGMNQIRDSPFRLPLLGPPISSERRTLNVRDINHSSSARHT